MMRHRLLRVTGYRGIALGLLGVIWVLTAVGITSGARPRVGFLDEYAPLWARSAVWLWPGLFAILAAMWRRWDSWAWTALIFPVALGLLVRVAALATQPFTGEAPPGVLIGVLLYTTVALLIYVCAAGLDRPLPWNGEERRQWTPKA
jgi:hypothetical protein